MTDDATAGNDQPVTLPPDVEPTFEAPWQARAFAIAVGLSEYYEGAYSWDDFQDRLVGEIEATAVTDGDSSEADYYDRWLRAVERIVVESGVLEADAVHERVREFATGERDASEFVAGDDEHGHGSGHHDHDHDQHHDHRHDHDHDQHHDHRRSQDGSADSTTGGREHSDR